MAQIVSFSSCFKSSRIRRGITARFLIRRKDEFCMTVSDNMPSWYAAEMFDGLYRFSIIDATVTDYYAGGSCTSVEIFVLIDDDGDIISVSQTAGITPADMVKVVSAIQKHLEA